MTATVPLMHACFCAPVRLYAGQPYLRFGIAEQNVSECVLTGLTVP